MDTTLGFFLFFFFVFFLFSFLLKTRSFVKQLLLLLLSIDLVIRQLPLVSLLTHILLLFLFYFKSKWKKKILRRLKAKKTIKRKRKPAADDVFFLKPTTTFVLRTFFSSLSTLIISYCYSSSTAYWFVLCAHCQTQECLMDRKIICVYVRMDVSVSGEWEFLFTNICFVLLILVTAFISLLCEWEIKASVCFLLLNKNICLGIKHVLGIKSLEN